MAGRFLEFTRCQRADGSHYGTGGQCRKGREVDPESVAKDIFKGLNLEGRTSPKPGAKRVGSGAFATAYDLGNGVILKKGKVGISEAQVMADLKHIPGVPRFLGSKITADERQSGLLVQGVIAMSKVPGVPISKLGSFKEKLEAWKQALPLLKKVHKAGYTHGDLHGGNFMYDTKSKTVSLVDFGLARNAKGRIDLQIKEVSEFVNDNSWVWGVEAANPFSPLGSFMRKAEDVFSNKVSKMSTSDLRGPEGKRILEELWDGVPD